MRKVIDWLHRNRIANGIILFAYFLLVVLPHETVGLFIMESLGHLSRSALNSSVLTFTLVLLSVFLFFLIKNLIKGDQKLIKLSYLILTLGLIALTYNTLFVLATECAHFPQYMVMAILVFPLTKNYSSTLFWATLLGAIDEGYQYFFLNPNATGYFDFNDIITDLLGAALGLIFLWSFGINTKPSIVRWYRKKTFLVGSGILLAGAMLKGLGVLSFYPDENNNALILLMNKVPESFWSYDKVGDLYYHVVHPVEGVVIICLLFLAYTFLGKERISFIDI